MKKNKLISTLQYVDPALIEEAMEGCKKESRFRFGTLIAACLCLVCSITALWYMANVKSGPSIEDPTLMTAGEEEVEPGATESDSYLRIAVMIAEGLYTEEHVVAFGSCERFCEENPWAEYEYYKSEDGAKESIVATIDQAVAEGSNVLVFVQHDDLSSVIAEAVTEKAEMYPDIYFVVLGVSAEDLREDYILPANVCCITYQEEVAGFMAGVAAVRLGYTKLGFLGAEENPRIMRYGYGFVQGADYAAELVGSSVEIRYTYANTMVSNRNLTYGMTEWYADGVEVIFSCGGEIDYSVAEAASQNGGKLIDVDTDHYFNEDFMYGLGTTLTAVTEELDRTVYGVLEDIAMERWENYAGQCIRLGLESATNSEENYIALSDSTCFAEGFTYEDYTALLEELINGRIFVSAGIDNAPATDCITVYYLSDVMAEPETEPETEEYTEEVPVHTGSGK